MHEGHRERLKNRFFANGLDGFAPHEVLELLLTFAIPQKDVNPIAHQLIETFGSVSDVLNAAPEELRRVPGVGMNASALLSLMPKLFGYYQRDSMRAYPMLRNFMQAGNYCKTLYYGKKTEQLYLLCLNAQGQLIAPVLLHEGTIDETVIYPRSVVEAALRHNAHAVLLSHNHPGGTLRPSMNDYESTRVVMDALAAVEIKLVDHIIVAGSDVASLARSRILVGGRLIDEQAFSVKIQEAKYTSGKTAKLSEGWMEEYGVFEPEEKE